MLTSATAGCDNSVAPKPYMPKTPPIVLTIAGHDPSSGAGITADIKTIAAHSCYGVSCITALTVQSTHGVRRVEPVAAETVRETLKVICSDVQIAAVRVGMLGSAAVGSAVFDVLEALKPPNVVIDPILKSSSGTDLVDEDGIEVLRRKLFALAAVITPNLDEAAALTGGAVQDPPGMRTAAGKLHDMGAANVVITGGHLQSPVDVLSSDGGRTVEEFPGEAIPSQSTHGTGCAFATAVACNLANDRSLSESVRLAGEYVRKAIAAAYPVGHGSGPLNHLFVLHPLTFHK